MSWIKGIEIEEQSSLENSPIRINIDCPFCDRRISLFLEETKVIRLIETLQYKLNKKKLETEEILANAKK